MNILSSSSAAVARFRRGPPTIAGVCVRTVRCSVSHVQSHGTVDFKQRPALKWSSLYRRISLAPMDPSAAETEAATLVEQWEAEERNLSKWEICRVAKELRKFRRFNLALEVYDWMISQGNRFTLSPSDMAVRLDLISKVHGIECAEDYFSQLPDSMKDKRTYGALLNVYCQASMREKAEATCEIMKNKGYTNDALPFNVMMTLYTNLGEHKRVNMVIEEMREKKIKLDIYSYNIWITNCAALDDSREMEKVVKLMTEDATVNANWTTYTTLASMYIKLGNIEKAQNCLKDAELRMTGRDRISFNYLLGLYGTIGKKEDVYRVWNWYKSSFPGILNLGYQTMICSLIKIGDTDGAEAIYDEWLSQTIHYDPRICNILMGCYVRQGLLGKARGTLEKMIEKGGKPKPVTWEILAEGHINEKQVSEALTCMKEAARHPATGSWRPKPVNISNILNLSKDLDAIEPVETIRSILSDLGCLHSKEYSSLLRAYSEAGMHS